MTNLLYSSFPNKNENQVYFCLFLGEMHNGMEHRVGMKIYFRNQQL